MPIHLSKPKFKACPFCGAAPRYLTCEDESLFSHNIVTWHTVSCYNCDVGGREENLDILVAWWNLRSRARLPTFKQVWKKQKAAGYAYGDEALAQVRFGYELAMATLRRPS